MCEVKCGVVCIYSMFSTMPINRLFKIYELCIDVMKYDYFAVTMGQLNK